MTKIVLTSSDFAALSAARRAGESRKHLWASIRRAFGLPTSLRLAVSTQRELYVKGTDPKQFLILGSNGRYSHTMVDPAPVNVIAPVAVPAADSGTATSSRFILAGGAGADTAWLKISVSELLEALRDDAVPECVEVKPGELPAGFPTDASRDVVVLDSGDNALYFRD